MWPLVSDQNNKTNPKDVDVFLLQDREGVKMVVVADGRGIDVI